MEEIDAKVILLGSACVGKTSLLERYVRDTFKEPKATVGAFFQLKVWQGHNIGIWDTAGQEKYNGLNAFYCRQTHAAILVYDITDEASFNKIPFYVELLYSSNAPGSVFIVLVGAKLDLVEANSDLRQVPITRGWEMASNLNAVFFETSAKTGANINDVFDSLGYNFFGKKKRPTNLDKCLSSPPSATPALNESLQTLVDSLEAVEERVISSSRNDVVYVHRNPPSNRSCCGSS
eukprot:TRINITY_DN1892_c0_g3_i1.p1 TRINITY_DN1892_c0_g3~~TRINITY_DN1892_c0_g3_i1.p1  ORF type:complete len:234 (+),score=46.75 TRINITY_DN1892_c0_g3_i1:69-770(+)